MAYTPQQGVPPPENLPVTPDARDATVGLEEVGTYLSLANLTNVFLECTFASDVDVSKLPLGQKSVLLRALEGPWAIGRMEQPELFQRLVPNEISRSYISRKHVELAWDVAGQTLRLRKLSSNALVVGGEPLFGGSFEPQEMIVGDGTEIGFCGTTTSLKVLTFRIHFRSAVKFDNLPRADAAPGDSYALVCIMAVGTNVSGLPHKAKAVELSPDIPLMVGRAHQQDLFEGLFKSVSGPDFLSTVSRSHFEVTPVESEGPGTFEVTNLSPNSFLVRGQVVGQRARAMLRAGDSIELVATSTCGSKVSFLSFQLQRLPDRERMTILPPDSKPPAAGVIAHEQQEPKAALSGYPMSWPAPQTAPPQRPPEPNTALGQRYRLVVTQAAGCDVMSLDVPERTIHFSVDGHLTVGRQHQVGFFEALVREDSGSEYLCRVSRSHLDIKPAEGYAEGCFMVTNLSINPVILCDWSQGLNETPLEQGSQGVLRLLGAIDFIAAAPDGSASSVVYLQLCLEETSAPACKVPCSAPIIGAEGYQRMISKSKRNKWACV